MPHPNKPGGKHEPHGGKPGGKRPATVPVKAPAKVPDGGGSKGEKGDAKK